MDDLFSDHVPLLAPWLEEDEVEAVAAVIRSGWISQGPVVAEFEEAVARYVGADHAVATNAATNALHLTLRLKGIGPEDEVLCPSFTCMANANAIVMSGARVRFVDIDRRTLNLDPEHVRSSVTERTAAILMVDQIGLPADLDALRAVADEKDLALIDDAATALGARYRDKPLGGWGVPACFSFHPRKMITTGEGGMLVTNDADLADRARTLRSTGASISDLERHKARGRLLQRYHESGYNYRMTDMQAALGLTQLKRLPDMLKSRQEQAERYDNAFRSVDEIETPFVPEWAQPAWSSYCIRIRPSAGVQVSDLVQRMADRGISTRHGIQPLHREPYFLGDDPPDLPETDAAARETMFLPIFPGLTPEQQRRVITELQASLRG